MSDATRCLTLADVLRLAGECDRAAVESARLGRARLARLQKKTAGEWRAVAARLVVAPDTIEVRS